MLFVLACGSSQAQADSFLDADAAGKKIADYWATQEYKAQLSKAFGETPASIINRCSTLKMSPVAVYFLDHFGVNDGGGLKSGAWKESYGFSGCGNDSILNFIFQISAQQTINLITALPGESRSSSVLQQDTLPNVITAVHVQNKTPCDNIEIINTTVATINNKKLQRLDPETVVASKPWYEVWTVAACGRKLLVPVQFIPDATGTGFNIVATDIIEQ